MSPADVLSLIRWAALLSGYSIPPEMVEVHYVPHAFLEAHVCDKPCNVIGWTDPTVRPVRVYIQDDQRENRGLYIHEFTHVGQTLAGWNLTTCEQSAQAERQAYATQDKYAEKTGGEITGPHPAECHKLRIPQ